MARILVVDDESSMREMLDIALARAGYEVAVADSRSGAAKALASAPVDVVVTDIRLGDGDGIEILRHVKSASPETVVIVMTAFGSARDAVDALKLGAADYLLKPFDIDELLMTLSKSLEGRRLVEENVALRAELTRQRGLEHMLGTSPPMLALFEVIRSVAPTGSTILLNGESGTGKELAARAIHALSPQSAGVFVGVNCGALPESLLESELFGHMKGAFTDAHQTKKGLFEQAHGGTLFLDEVSEMPAVMQVKLLRALQDRRIRRIGGTEEVEIDVRIIAATNQPLSERVARGEFREDLFYRLNVIPLDLPPLRDRAEQDVPLLIAHFIPRFCARMGKSVRGVARDALEAMISYRWPGNVRELENVLERAVALETTQEIQLGRLPVTVREGLREAHCEPGRAEFRLDEYLAGEERRLVVAALGQAEGDRRAAARSLGVSPRSLRYLIQKHREFIPDAKKRRA